MKSKFTIAIAMLLSCLIQVRAQEIVNPLQYGLKDAKTALERYDVLLKCHQDAVKKSAKVSYAGIGSIEIEIPEKLTTIPLTKETDFAGCTINVLNRQKKAVFLFARVNKTKPIEVPSSNIDRADYRSIPELRNGIYILVVSDESSWVEQRAGRDYGATRKDIVLVRDGIGSNKPIMPYENPQSKVTCSYFPVDDSQIVVENLNIERNASSTAITNLFHFEVLNNVMIKNISAVTPENTGFTNDRMITVINCTNVKFEHLRINGTYSSTEHSGYAFALDNIWNHRVSDVYAKGNWGVYGTNNINNAFLSDCEINRFDIHCYGRDAKFYNCKFTDLYNQFSSMFGDVCFEKCMFTNFTPALIESSYNAYTPFDLTFKNCTFNFTAKRNYLLTLMKLNDVRNSRPELSRKSLPNITIKNCTVNLDDDVKEWYIVYTGKVTYKESLDYINKIEINRMKIYGNVDYQVFSSAIETTEPLKFIRKRIKMK